MGKSSKVIQSSSCVTKQTYVFSCVFSFSSVWCVLSFYLKAPAATPMFWRSMSPGQTLAQCSAVQRRHYRGHSRPAGGVAFPAARSLYCSQVATTFAFFFFSCFFCVGNTFSSVCYGSCEWISPSSSVPHRWPSFASFICSPPLTGGTIRWLSTSTTSSRASALSHTSLFRVCDTNKSLLTSFFLLAQHTSTSVHMLYCFNAKSFSPLCHV